MTRPEWMREFSAWWDGPRQFDRYYARRKVYAISEGYGAPVKIGITADMKVRFENLRGATWRTLYLCWDADGSSVHEAALKHVLKRKVLKCEWVNDPDDMVKNLLMVGSNTEQLEAAIATLAGFMEVSPSKYPREKRAPGADVPVLPRFREAS